MASVQIRTECLVVAPSGRGLDERLATQAASRGWSVRLIGDACIALAHACLHDRLSRERESAHGATADRVVLLLTEPHAIPRLEHFLEAVRAHAIRTPVWCVTEGQFTPLIMGTAGAEAASDPSPAGSSTRSAAPPASPRSSHPPSLRLAETAEGSTEESDDEAQDGVPPSFEDAPPMTTITPEEYDMLFRRDDPESPS